MGIDRVGVIGAGTMGNGIAHVFAEQRLSGDFVRHRTEISGSRSRDHHQKSRPRTRKEQNHRGAEIRDAEADRSRPWIVRRLAECDFIVEAASEKLEIKSELFRDLDRICRPEVILASNTSSISITKLAAVTKRPQKVIGMHFFNPVPVMKLVEIVRGLATSDETFQTVRELALKLEKTPVEVNDAPGFVSNRVLMPLLNEAMYAVMEGVATAGSRRRSFQAGHEPSHGAADAGGFHRARCLPRHHAGAAQRARRSQIPSRARCW